MTVLPHLQLREGGAVKSITNLKLSDKKTAFPERNTEALEQFAYMIVTCHDQFTLQLLFISNAVQSSTDV